MSTVLHRRILITQKEEEDIAGLGDPMAPVQQATEVGQERKPIRASYEIEQEENQVQTLLALMLGFQRTKAGLRRL